MTSQSQATVRLARIIEAACDGTGFTMEEVCGPSRVAAVCRARRLAVLAAHRHGFTLKQIRGALGDRGPTAIGYDLRRAQGQTPRQAGAWSGRHL